MPRRAAIPTRPNPPKYHFCQCETGFIHGWQLLPCRHHRQPEASLAASGGPYSLRGGFWVTTALPTAGAPALCVAGAGGSVTLFWPSPTGWTLQQNSDLANPAGWADSSRYSTVNGTNYLTLANPSGNLFFRLRH